MVIGSPSLVLTERLRDSISAMATAHCGMMLESMLADNMHQRRQRRNVDDSARAKGIERIVRKLTLCHISTD
jgi:hypothetical protein